MTNWTTSIGRLRPTVIAIAAAGILVPAPASAQWGYSEGLGVDEAGPTAYVPVGDGVVLQVLCGSSGPVITLDTDLETMQGAEVASMLVLRIDRRRFNVPVTYVPSERLAYGKPSPDLLAALMSGSTGTVRSNELGRYAFGLVGSSPSIRKALAPCVAIGQPQRSVPAASRDGLDELRTALVAKLQPECSKLGGGRVSIAAEAFRIDGGLVTVDYHHVFCPGGPAGAGYCGAAQCQQEVYAPSGSGYALVRSYYQ